MLCGDLDGWEGGRGREVQEGGDICIHTADSLCYTAETNTTLLSNYTPIKKTVQLHVFLICVIKTHT